MGRLSIFSVVCTEKVWVCVCSVYYISVCTWYVYVMCGMFFVCETDETMRNSVLFIRGAAQHITHLELLHVNAHTHTRTQMPHTCATFTHGHVDCVAVCVRV